MTLARITVFIKGQKCIYHSPDGGSVPVIVDAVKNMFGEQWVRFRHSHKWMKASEVEAYPD